jgi:leader peptidase (prepilin peptidase)/N-methyltransferase
MIISQLFELIFIFSFGAILGSFFNVLICRLPNGLSVIYPSSSCPKCGHKITAIENIPILSYLFLLGKCSKCHTKISLQYPTIELITALFAIFYYYFKFYNSDLIFSQARPVLEYLTIFYPLVAFLLLIPISIIDIRHYIIPDSITIGGTVGAILMAFIPNGISPAESIIGLFSGGGILYIFAILGEKAFKKEALGGGDIKLMAFIGALWGYKIAIATIMFGSLLGTIIISLLIFLKVVERDREIPFGPFLSMGAVISIFWGEPIINWYFNLTILG